jgi:hypothetical protein
MSRRFVDWVGDGGIRLWSVALAGVAAWAVHLLFVASFVRFSCNRAGVGWVPHAVTAGTAALTVAAMLVCAVLARSEPDDEATPAARTTFIARVGLLVGGVNLVLILAEGSYVSAVHRCG